MYPQAQVEYAVALDTTPVVFGNLYEMNPSLSQIWSVNDQFFGELLDFELEELESHYE